MVDERFDVDSICIDFLSEKSTIFERIKYSLSHVGFLICLNHGVSDEVIEQAMREQRLFFESSLEDKVQSCSRDSARRGYSALGTENFSSLIGLNRPNDDVEKFRMGPPARDEESSDSDAYYNSKEGRLHYFPNTYPSLQQPAFQPVLTKYYEAMSDFSLRLLELLETSFALPPTYFKNKMNKETSILTANYFPDNKEATAVVRIADHVDISMLTIVCQSAAGLEILMRDEKWFEIPFLPNALIVNIGDCLQDWSSGLLRSTRHRVRLYPDIGASVRMRLSLAFFLSPNYDVDMDWPGSSAPSVVDLNDELATHIIDRAMTYSQWRQQRIKRAMKKSSS